MKSRRASAAIIVILSLALAALLAPKVAPKIFDSRTREAEKSKDTTTQLLAASDKLGAAQTASAQVIGEAAHALPQSPDRDFIINEIPIMLARGPSPDPKQIIAARDRRIAYLEGKLKAQEELTEKAFKEAGKLHEGIVSAIADKRASDEALAESAAFQRGKDIALSAAAFVILILAVGGGYLWIRSRGLSRVLSKVVPTIDDKGTDTIFDALARKMDASEKKLIHKIRASLTK